MSISLHHFKGILNSLGEADLHAQIMDLDIFEYPEYLAISVRWYDGSEMSYKFYLNEEESFEALSYAHESNYNVHMWSELADRIIAQAEYDYMEGHEEI